MKKIFKTIWKYLLAIGETRAEMVKHQKYYNRGY